MKKIFMGSMPLFLATPKEIELLSKKDLEHTHKTVLDDVDYTMMKNFISAYEKGKPGQPQMLVYKPLKKLNEAFFSNFKLVKAAGGVVTNEEEKTLLIFRRGKWDLPKGKVEREEHLEEAAVREVEEETGVTNLKIVHRLKFLSGAQDCTYHTYMEKGKRILKATAWFKMTCKKSGEPKPQIKEGITKAQWHTKAEATKLFSDTYASIQDVFDAAFHSQ